MRMKFTPLIDQMVERYGLITAAVYGKISRVCDWSPMHVCTLSNESMASQLGIGVTSVKEAKNVLAQDGFIKVTGRKGKTSSITVTEEVVMDCYLPGRQTATSKGRGGRQTATTWPPDGHEDTYKETKDKETKGKKGDLLDGMLRWAQPEDRVNLHWCPEPLLDHMRPFMEMFPRKEPSQAEQRKFIAGVQEWIERGYRADDVKRAYATAVEEGISITGPQSIMFAFDNLPKSDLDARREKLYGKK